jgi:hypothetical protein
MTGALAGVKVCVFENGSVNESYCATTDSNGLFAIYQLPEADYYILAFTKTGYQSNLQLAFGNIATSSVLYSEEEISGAAGLVGATYPASGKGLLTFVAFNSTGAAVSGYTVATTPNSGEGPYYADGNGLLDQNLAATSTSGWGAFFNMDPGNYDVDFTHASTNCEDLPGVMVVDGYLTYAVTGCL